MFCSECGSKLAPESKFCSGCGAKVKLVTEPSPVAANAKSDTANVPTVFAPTVVARDVQNADMAVSRRQLTVLFCDLVGSTAMAERMDPEDLFAAMSSYHQMVKQIAAAHGGYVAKVVGDGVDLYFGYPLANEDDVARAVHAGLAITAGIGKLTDTKGKSYGLQLRVGIATGRVTVGVYGELSIAGATPNLAARIQAEAGAGQVFIAPTTRRIAGAQFTYESKGEYQLKGFSDAVTVSAVTGVAKADSRSAWRGRDNTRKMFGRSQELAVLTDAWSRIGERPSHAVLLRAEAGMGKSRLATALMGELQGSPHVTVRLQCSPFHTNTVLYPFVQHLVSAAGIQRHDLSLTQAEKLEAQLAIAGITEPIQLALVAALVGISVPGRYPPLEMPPPAIAAMTQELLLGYFASLCSLATVSANEAVLAHYMKGMSKEQPLLVVVEDLHWMDPTSLDLIQKLVGSNKLSNALMVLTARPEYQVEVTSAHLSIVDLTPLDTQAAREMVQNLCDSVALPPEAVDIILVKTGGVPLFIEEMTQMVQDTAVGGGESGATLAAGQSVPDTLVDLLMERLDRLGEAKQLVQIAAVIGNAFPEELLRAIAKDLPSYERDLKTLCDAQMLLGFGTSSLQFKHALIENTAYDSTLLKTRVALHERVAHCLQQDFSELGAAHPEILAHHMGRAKRNLESARYLLQAALRGLQNGAPREAAEHLQAGLAILSSEDASAAKSELELQLLSVLGPTIMVLRGPGSPEFGKVQQRAFDLCHSILGAPRQFPITYGLCLYHWGRAEFETANKLVSVLLEDANASQDHEAVMASGNMGGMVALHLGMPKRALELLQRSVSLYQPERDAALYPVYMMDFGIFGRFYLALAAFVCGDALAAKQHAADAYVLAQKMNQPHSLGFSLLANFNIAAMNRDTATALEFAQQCVGFASQMGFPEFIGMARVVRGWATGVSGNPQEGLADLDEGVKLWQMTGFENWQSWFSCLRAELLLMLGLVTQAQTEVDAQLARIMGNGEMFFKVPLLLAKAQVLQALGKDSDSAACHTEAKALAVSQSAHGWIV